MKPRWVCEFAMLILSSFALLPQATQGQDEPSQSDFDPFSPAIIAAEEEPAVPQQPLGRASARISDDVEEVDAEPGFKWPALPKPKLPTLPKPTLPKLTLPSWTTTREVRREAGMRMPEEPSAWEKFSTGTKEAFSKTKHTLMPWTKDDEEVVQRRPTSSAGRRAPQRTAAKPKGRQVSAEKKSLFPFFQPKPEQEDPFKDGVNGFLAQPRPE